MPINTPILIDFLVPSVVQILAMGMTERPDGTPILGITINDTFYTFDDDDALHGLVEGINDWWPRVLAARKEKEESEKDA